ncbi:MAG: FAD-dependent oxidoreductase [Pseudomonadota bacterium]
MVADTTVSQTPQLDPSDPYVRQAQTFPTLTNEQIERASVFGKIEDLKKGTVVFERGDRTVDFFIVLKGNIEIYEHRRDGLNVFTVHGENQFTGELDLFNDRQILVGGRMGEDGKVVRIERANFKKMMTAETDIAEIIMRAFILRRVGLISHRQGGVTLVGSRQCPNTLRIERFLKRNGYPVEHIHNSDEDICWEIVEKYKIDKKKDLPAVLIHLGEDLLRNPSTMELAEALGLVEELDHEKAYDVAIVGAGPSGLSAATYGASEGLKTVLLEGEAPGGQASTSSKIENYLGFPTGISGQALAGRAQVQAQKFGAKIALPRAVSAIDCENGSPFKITLNDGSKIKSKSVVVTSGARYRKLNLPDEDKFENAGLHYAATAMESSLCEAQEVIVVGGGNSAGQAAVFMSQHASHVHIFVRSDSLAASMSDYLIERIDSSKRITLHRQTQITELKGKNHLEEVTWLDKVSGEHITKPIRHVFLMIGAMPNTDWLEGCVQLDEKGFILTGRQVTDLDHWPEGRAPFMLETSVPGIFAAGDVRSNSIKRVASAVGEGSMTISHVHQFLAES